MKKDQLIDEMLSIEVSIEEITKFFEMPALPEMWPAIDTRQPKTILEDDMKFETRKELAAIFNQIVIHAPASDVATLLGKICADQRRRGLIEMEDALEELAISIEGAIVNAYIAKHRRKLLAFFAHVPEVQENEKDIEDEDLIEIVDTFLLTDILNRIENLMGFHKTI